MTFGPGSVPPTPVSPAARPLPPAAATVVSPAIRRSILLLSFATFASMVAQRICDAMLPELSRTFAVSLAQAASVVSVFAVVYGASQLVYGPLGDRLGKFGVVTWATLACSVGSLVAVFAGSLSMLVFARVLMALGAAAIIPLSMAWIGDEVAYEQRQETLARVGLGTTLGIGFGQLAGGLLTDTLGWRWAFGLMTVLFGAVGWLLHANWRGQPARPAKSIEPEAGPAPGFVAQALGIVTGPWSRIVLIVAFLEGASGFGVLAIWALHLNRSLALSLSASGAIVALFGVGGVFYMVFARHLIRRLGERGLALVGGALLGLSALCVGFVPVWWLALVASLLGGFGFFMFHNTMQTNATQMSTRARGTGVSLFAASLFMGQSAGVLMATQLVGALGSGLVIALGGAVMAALGLVFSLALKQRERLIRQGQVDESLPA